MANTQVIDTLLSLLFSEELSKNFNVEAVDEYSSHIEIVLHELSNLIPSSLSDSKEVVLDGFCNPKELQSFPLKGKSVYLKVYRRRWKESGSSIHYSNTYNLNQEGVKATKPLSAFLKGTLGHSTSEYKNNRRCFVSKF